MSSHDGYVERCDVVVSVTHHAKYNRFEITRLATVSLPSLSHVQMALERMTERATLETGRYLQDFGEPEPEAEQPSEEMELTIPDVLPVPQSAGDTPLYTAGESE